MWKILFRGTLAEQGELETAKKYFEVIESRSLIKPGDNIICRYSALPYYEELERDVVISGGKLINSYRQHHYVAGFWNWYQDLKKLTPDSYDCLENLARMRGPFVIKGTTNSRKHNWNTHMFAETYEEAKAVTYKLMDDSFISDQGIIFRKYEPFVSYGTAINGLPITKEFRFFIFSGNIVAGDFYWANQPEVIEEFKPDVKEVPISFLNKIIERVGDKVNFYVVDVAQRKDGEWRVVELNDAQMSGLSCIDADLFYRSLKACVG